MSPLKVNKPLRVTVASMAAVLSVFIPRHSAQAQGLEERLSSLAEHAVPIRTIDPADEDFSDLEGLRDVFDSVRVVLLGEQSHGDGATFLAKARLIKFLHQEMGFDVLAFESGFYDCGVADAHLRDGEDAHTAVRRCVFTLWTESAEFQPMIDYVEQARSAGRPLQIIGFDNQMTGSASTDFLFDELQALSERTSSTFDWQMYGELLRGIVGNDLSVLSDEDTKNSFEEALMGFGRDVADSSLHDREYWVQVLRSLGAWVQGLSVVDGGQGVTISASSRTKQMAENLLWHLENLDQDSKVIVWAATFHTARNLDLIDGYDDLRVMGSYLEEELGRDMYSVGFIAYEGEAGLHRSPPSPIEVASPETLEHMLAEAGLDLAFIDLRDLGGPVAWLGEPITSRPLGYVPMTAPWGEVLDGFVFTRTMTPSTPVEP